MKRFFQRLDNSSSSYQRDYHRDRVDPGPSSHSSSGSFIGKVFTLGQYQCTVEDVIAEGGFALVFLVKANNGIRYALKRLHVNNEQDLANCKREIEIARKLGSHPNIVQLVESSVNYCGNEVYEILLLMQYCKSSLLTLLNDRLGSGGLAESDVVRVLCDLCKAVAKMHHNDPPIIHRDLKIENILMEDNHYLLCDFGSATTKVLSTKSQSALSIDEEIKRFTTLAYRAPEMVDVYSGRAITSKADIWALGCLLYKLCYLSLPFGESTLAIQNAHVTIPDQHAERYSSRVAALIAYMLVADPDQRPDIFQVATLAFDLAGHECPVVNKFKSPVPKWSDLRVPPTESAAREVKRTSTSSTSATHLHPTASAHREPDKTSVTPRQRPKPSININSVLPTSPISFQRATTPNEASSATNLAVKPEPPLPSMSNSHSFSSSKQLFDDSSDDWSKQGTKMTSSNPQLNEEPKFISDLAVSSKNPFIEVPIPQLPRPPSGTRRTQTPPGSEFASSEPPPTSGSYHHRRNQSDTSAFTVKPPTVAQLSGPHVAQKNGNNSTKSLNPFEDHVDYSYEDQLFGHEFDKIRQQSQPASELNYDPFESAPFDPDRLKRYLVKQQHSPSPATLLSTSTSGHSLNTVITIRSNDFTIHQVDRSKEPSSSSSSAFITVPPRVEVRAPQEDQQSKVTTSNQSVSSSSQGLVPASPTANYMPLYSSDTAEDDDEDDDPEEEEHHLDTVDLGLDHDDDDHFETSGDLTKPLVGDDDEEEDEDEVELDDEDDDLADHESSIGSASDLQNSSDSDSIDSRSDNSDSESEDEKRSTDGETNENSDGFEFVNFDDNSKMTTSTSTIKYGLVKNLPEETKPTKGANISRVQIGCTTDSIGTGTTNEDGTSVSNSSVSSSVKNAGESIDHIIGHLEGHRPLLEEEDEEETSQVKPFIEMDAEPLPIVIVPQHQSVPVPVPIPVSTDFSFSVSSLEPYSSNSLSTNHSSDFDLNQVSDESEETRRLDEEVERSLTSQVIYDQLNHKDLFGSIPFTDKELINKTIIEQEEVKKSHKFENSFSDVPPESLPVVTSNVVEESKPTDLFGAVPFSASASAPKPEIAPKPAVQAKPIVLPPPPVIPAKPVIGAPPGVAVTVTSVSTVPLVAPKSTLSSEPKAVPQTTVAVGTVVASTVIATSTSTASSTVVPPSSATTTAPIGLSKLGRNSLQKSNLKLKSKVAKKYEVQESDDEVDGLLDLSNEHEEDEAETINLKDKAKKSKKDKKDKPEKEKKSKEKKEKEEKKSKSKEKPDKEKKKGKEEKVKVKEKEKADKEKEKAEKEKEKAEKEKKKKEKKEAKEKEKKEKVRKSSGTDVEKRPEVERRDSKMSASLHQAFANMSFEDEVSQQPSVRPQATAHSPSVTITRC